jgi:hypothetical protein
MEANCVLHQAKTDKLNIISVSSILHSVNNCIWLAYEKRKAATALHKTIGDNHAERNGKTMRVMLCSFWQCVMLRIERAVFEYTFFKINTGLQSNGFRNTN